MTEDLEQWAMREFIKTMPVEQATNETAFYRGVEGIKVHLVDGPMNPYKAMFTIAASTWGNALAMNKWKDAHPEARFHMVKAILLRKTLPNAMEAPSFTYEISGPSRAAFDQIARARIGAVFGSMGWRDNNHSDIGFRIPEAIWNNPSAVNLFTKSALKAKAFYVDYLEMGQGNWQDARAILPISAVHRWSMGINYMALQNMMSKRLMFNEQADTVATAWLMRERILEVYNLLGRFLRPTSDWAGRCTEHGDAIGEQFGNLFKCSGRWECEQADDKFTFNTSCSNRESMMKQLGIYIPEGAEDMPSMDMKYEDLNSRDKLSFESD